ncbi:MAG: DUF222 domain-containing protein [Acidimicrobiales bacterium]
MLDWSELERRASHLDDVEVSGASNDELYVAAVAIERIRSHVDALQCRVLAELDARSATDIDHGLRTRAWLARETGMSPATAGARLRVGNKLRLHLPGTEAALREGSITFDQAKVMVDALNPRILDEFTAHEADLLAMVPDLPFDRWRQLVTTTAVMLDQDGGYDPASDPEANELRLIRLLDGNLQVAGNLIGEPAVIVTHTLEQVADELFRRYRKDAELAAGPGGEPAAVPSRVVLRALALVEICRRAMAVDQRTHTPPRTEAVIVLDGDHLDSAATPAPATDEHGMPILGSITRLMCDASAYAVVLNSLGVPLDMGREVRTATPAQRRALARRDGGCVFPGCGCHVNWTDAHHIDWWGRDMGGTDVQRMVLLCRHHHGVVHRTGWNIGMGDDGWTWLTTPGGDVLWGQQHGAQRAGPAPPLAA